jgi:hypothetical protein
MSVLGGYFVKIQIRGVLHFTLLVTLELKKMIQYINNHPYFSQEPGKSS